MSDVRLDMTVLLLCYNEEESLPKVIGDIHAALHGLKYSYEILVVDDGSTDHSVSVIQGLSCRLIQLPTRHGAGAAYKTGILSAQGAIIVILDADGTYTAADIPKMLACFPEFDLVNGARTSEKGDLPLLRAPAKWLVRMFVSILANKRIPDLQTGLKAFKKDMLLPYLWLIPDKFSYATLTTLVFLCNGHQVKYIPTEYHKRLGGRSKFHPIRDTAYVLMQVCRVMMHFNPVIRNLIKLSAVMTICCLGIAVYSNTFFSSFHYDDKIYIINDPFIRNIHNFLSHWEFYPCRFITFLSFVVNYHFNRSNVFGYHLFNLALHLASAILVWWLTLLTLSTPALKNNKITRHAHFIALFSGLVFVSHPLQTEAVTYIWQRVASMVTLFYLASLCFYVKSRLLAVGKRKSAPANVYYICSLLMVVVAMFTKENAITLPLMILFYDFIFFEDNKKLNWSSFSTLVVTRRDLWPFLTALSIIPVTILLTQARQFQEIQRFVQGPGGISPIEYLLTQFRVITDYIRLVFIPLNQNLDHDFSVSKNIFELPVLFSCLFLTTILFFAKYIFIKYRLVSFSIFWFFLTLLPESSFFPLKNIIAEHRLYLPMVGYSIFLVSGLYYLLVAHDGHSSVFSKSNFKTMVMALMLIIACNSVLTYQRNKVWQTEFTLWDDAAQKSPHKARPHNNRGVLYEKQGDLTQALADFNKAIEIDPGYAEAYYNRGNVLRTEGDLTHALADFSKAIEIEPDYIKAYNNRGDIYRNQGEFTLALTDYNKIIGINPNYAQAYNNLGIIHSQQGDFTQALADFNKAIEINPDFAAVYYNRGNVYGQLGNLTQALADYNKAATLGLTIDPNLIADLMKASGRDR